MFNLIEIIGPGLAWLVARGSHSRHLDLWRQEDDGQDKTISRTNSVTTGQVTADF